MAYFFLDIVYGHVGIKLIRREVRDQVIHIEIEQSAVYFHHPSSPFLVLSFQVKSGNIKQSHSGRSRHIYAYSEPCVTLAYSEPWYI